MGFGADRGRFAEFAAPGFQFSGLVGMKAEGLGIFRAFGLELRDCRWLTFEALGLSVEWFTKLPAWDVVLVGSVGVDL